MRGREAFAAALRPALGQVHIEGRSEIKEIHVAENYAFCWSQLSLTVTSVSGRACPTARWSDVSLSQRARWTLGSLSRCEHAHGGINVKLSKTGNRQQEGALAYIDQKSLRTCDQCRPSGSLLKPSRTFVTLDRLNQPYEPSRSGVESTGNPVSGPSRLSGFLGAWLVVAIMGQTGLSRYVWHLPLFFFALVVLFGSVIGMLLLP